jgi:hypothetical protein
MSYVYYVDGEKFITNLIRNVPWDEISSFNEETPALEDLSDGYKEWCLKGRIRHRLTGPAVIWPNANNVKDFYLNENYYKSVRDWINDHPNSDLYFQIIGVFTETDKVLWFLQN